MRKTLHRARLRHSKPQRLQEEGKTEEEKPAWSPVSLSAVSILLSPFYVAWGPGSRAPRIEPSLIQWQGASAVGISFKVRVLVGVLFWHARAFHTLVCLSMSSCIFGFRCMLATGRSRKAQAGKFVGIVIDIPPFPSHLISSRLISSHRPSPLSTPVTPSHPSHLMVVSGRDHID